MGRSAKRPRVAPPPKFPPFPLSRDDWRFVCFSHPRTNLEFSTTRGANAKNLVLHHIRTENHDGSHFAEALALLVRRNAAQAELQQQRRDALAERERHDREALGFLWHVLPQVRTIATSNIVAFTPDSVQVTSSTRPQPWTPGTPCFCRKACHHSGHFGYMVRLLDCRELVAQGHALLCLRLCHRWFDGLLPLVAAYWG